MTDKIQLGFEAFASKHGFDLSSAGGRYNSPVVRWMWAAWQHQAETITDLHAALSRSTARNARLMNQCRDHDTRRAAAVAQAAAMAEEIERLNDVIARLADELDSARETETIKWISVDEDKPALSDDVLVTLLIDGDETDWKAGYWDGEYWYTLDTEHDEPIQVNAGCNFVVTHWTRVLPAGVAL